MPRRVEKRSDWDWGGELFKRPGDDPKNEIHRLIGQLELISAEVKAAEQSGQDTTHLFQKEQEIVNRLEEIGYFKGL